MKKGNFSFKGVKPGKFRRLGSKLSSLILMGVIFCALIISSVSYFIFFTTSIGYKQELIKAAVAAGTSVINPEEFREWDETNVADDNYYKSYGSLKKLREEMNIKLLYTMSEVEDGYKYVLDSMTPEEFPELASVLGGIDSLEEYGPEPIEALRSKQIIISDIYDGGEGYGYLISAFAPIIDGSGEAIGIVGADISVSDVVNSMAGFAIGFLAIIIACCSAVVIISKQYVKKLLDRPIKRLSEASKELAAGKVDINIDNYANDEIGQLSEDFKTVAGVINRLVEDIHGMAIHYNEGALDARINLEGLNGAYLEMSEAINEMASSMNGVTLEVLGVMRDFGSGKFEVKLPKYKGKKAAVNQAVDLVSENMKMINKDIQAMLKAVINGNLSLRVDESRYEGGWAEIINGLNGVMIAVSTPIGQARQALEAISEGHLNISMSGEYNGDFADIKQALNSTAYTIKEMITDIDRILRGISENNLNQEVTSEYKGDFSEIKSAINRILDTLNQVIGEINVASINVKTGSEGISRFGSELAEGVNEQNSALIELGGSVSKMGEQTKNSAENSNDMSQIAIFTRGNVQNCNETMAELKLAMDGIMESAKSIEGINNLIEGIAFQTKLLSLNAAIEAAKSGIHGKGFGIVADEVRRLSEHSKNAADDTAKLINATIEKVGQGYKTAEVTALSLKKISSNINKIVEIAGRMSNSADEQAEAVSLINEKIDKISQVVQTNTVVANDSADASRQLLAQSDKLNEMIEPFEFRDRGMM
ncbi:MAG: methyl-accepting chemotaxis protein [Clostridiales bacterium]|jgi:methyl-accepting chemotaxis protein|nr:methyl-accepting chemotaxis protein [Clostridiales bacterium]